MSRAFIAFYMSDYARDTGHLSTLEHGAYFLLLQHCWTHDGAIPVCQKARAALAQVPRSTWYRIRTNIEPFFDEHGRQKRAVQAVEKADKLILKQAMAGHRGAAKRWGKPITTANGHGHMTVAIKKHGHGVAIKKEDITTTTSVAAREGSAMEPVAKPVIPVSAEFVATIQKKRWVGA